MAAMKIWIKLGRNGLEISARRDEAPLALENTSTVYNYFTFFASTFTPTIEEDS